jgi:sigma-B regulation protein RsbU (phosphoserine phosphatase)
LDPLTLRLIARHGLFADVSVEALKSLTEDCPLRLLKIGDVLLAPGQMNRNLYLLLDGRLKVHIDRIDSEESFLILPGECAGEISVIDCRPATAYVVADEPSLILVMPESALWKTFFPIPAVAKNFMRLFADRLRARTEVMQQALEQQLRYEHLQRELSIAQEIQLGMVPRTFDLSPGLEVAASMIPAQQIGGDFYDAFPVSKEEFCIAIGDVSGKGVPAALFMVRTMTLLRSEMLKTTAVETALQSFNALLCHENPTSMFATLIVGILNNRTGRFRYANAGHEPIILGRKDSFRPLDPPPGILVGIDPGASYAVADVTLRKDDVLVLYTDGVTEAMDSQQRMFTQERLLECLDPGDAHCAQDMVNTINLTVRRFAAGTPQSDDITAMVLRYLGS